ncbi:MAG: DUF535 domain-containing protein [Hymenobacter sp.]|nr:MAG: DUF535 domain-containing protein [Hymenobacter sp.]
MAQLIAALPGGYVLRDGFRTAQGWLNYQRFRRLQKMLAHPALRKLSLRHGRLAYKYLVPSLVAGLSRSQRLAVMLHHYESILHHLRPAFFDWVLQEHGIWQAQSETNQFSITLAYPFESDFEGELSVVFRVDNTPVYTISFTLAPGWVLHAAAPTVLLVSRVQGTKNFALIKQATKSLHDSTPAALLMQAVYGIALAGNIPLILGIGTAAQISRTKADNQFDYDGFWQQFGATLVAGGLFLLPLPVLEKPIETVKANHRARTLRKRQYKHEVRVSIQQYVTHHLLAEARAAL